MYASAGTTISNRKREHRDRGNRTSLSIEVLLVLPESWVDSEALVVKERVPYDNSYAPKAQSQRLAPANCAWTAYTVVHAGLLACPDCWGDYGVIQGAVRRTLTIRRCTTVEKRSQRQCVRVGRWMIVGCGWPT